MTTPCRGRLKFSEMLVSCLIPLFVFPFVHCNTNKIVISPLHKAEKGWRWYTGVPKSAPPPWLAPVTRDMRFFLAEFDKYAMEYYQMKNDLQKFGDRINPMRESGELEHTCMDDFEEMQELESAHVYSSPCVICDYDLMAHHVGEFENKMIKVFGHRLFYIQHYYHHAAFRSMFFIKSHKHLVEKFVHKTLFQIARPRFAISSLLVKKMVDAQHAQQAETVELTRESTSPSKPADEDVELTHNINNGASVRK